MNHAQNHISKYNALNGKTVNQTAIGKVLHPLQICIKKGHIRKTDPLAKQIAKVKANLIKAYNEASNEDIQLEIVPVITKQKPNKPKTKSTNNQINKSTNKPKTKSTNNQINKSTTKPNTQIKADKSTNSKKPTNRKPVKPKTENPKTEFQKTATSKKKVTKSKPSLKGVSEAKEMGVMSPNQILQENYTTIPWQHPWDKLIGEACSPTHIFISGPGGTGKSGNMLKLADDLSKIGQKILYVSGEQFGTPTLQQLIREVDLSHPQNITIVDVIDRSDPKKNPKNYNWVMLDSKDELEISSEDFKKLKKEFPKQSFVILSHNNKDGNYRGEGNWRNIVDTMLNCYELGKMRTFEKNRWGSFSDEQMFTPNNIETTLTPTENV